MKYLIFTSVLAILGYGIAEDAGVNMAEIADHCISSTGANDDDVLDLMQKKVPTRKEGKCLIACFLKSLKVMKDGKFNKQASLDLVSSLKTKNPELYKQVEKINNKCSEEMLKVKELDECEYAAKITVCSQKAAEEFGVDVEDLI